MVTFAIVIFGIVIFNFENPTFILISVLNSFPPFYNHLSSPPQIPFEKLPLHEELHINILGIALLYFL